MVPRGLCNGPDRRLVNQATDAADSLRTPMSLAWDGTNLYVSDAYNRRITIYSVGENTVPYSGVRNSASLNFWPAAASPFPAAFRWETPSPSTSAAPPPPIVPGAVTTTGGADYKYTVVKDDTISTIVTSLAPSSMPQMTVMATRTFMPPPIWPPGRAADLQEAGTDGNEITECHGDHGNSATTALLVATASGATLSGGGDAAKIAPGSIVSVLGTNLAYHTASVDPTESAAQQAGRRTGLLQRHCGAAVMVSPEKINAQVPWELGDTTSINAYVRAERIRRSGDGDHARGRNHRDGQSWNLRPAGHGPSVGIVYHASSNASGLVSVDGTATAADTATVTIEDRSYTYTVQSGDTLNGIRDALVNLINQDPKVTATPSGEFQRIILQARVQGPEGNGLRPPPAPVPRPR